MKKILIVDDDRDLLISLSNNLSKVFQVVCKTNIKEADETLKASSFDLLLSDYFIGDEFADELLKRRSTWRSKCIVFVMTGDPRSDVLQKLINHRIDGIFEKPDVDPDNVVKRFIEISEVPLSEFQFAFNELKFDSASRTVIVDDKEHTVTPVESKILTILCENPGQAMEKKKLLKLVWGDDAEDVNLLESQISGIRKKSPDLKKLIVSVYGIGYKLAVTK